MDWLRRLWAARKQLSVAASAPFLTGERLWIAAGAVVLLGIALIIAVCWLTHRTKDEEDVDIKSPLLSVRRGSKRNEPENGGEKTEEKTEKGEAKAS